MIKIERIYDNPRGNNNFRILVDRLWPRGLSKDKVKVNLWQKDIAPSNSLRKWFGHDDQKWNEFKRRYFKELDKNVDSVKQILDKRGIDNLTIWFKRRKIQQCSSLEGIPRRENQKVEL
ncbi:MAG: DUF488 family protein [Candidatus Nitrosopolaris sp.]